VIFYELICLTTHVHSGYVLVNHLHSHEKIDGIARL
jgi:hypothetical protein